MIRVGVPCPAWSPCFAGHCDSGRAAASDATLSGKVIDSRLEDGFYVLHASTKAKSASDRYYALQTVELTDRDVDQVSLVLRRSVTIRAVFKMAEENVAVPKGVFLIAGPLDPWPDAAGAGSANEWRGLPPGEYRPLPMGAGMRGYAVAAVLYGGNRLQGPLRSRPPTRRSRSF